MLGLVKFSSANVLSSSLIKEKKLSTEAIEG